MRGDARQVPPASLVTVGPISPCIQTLLLLIYNGCVSFRLLNKETNKKRKDMDKKGKKAKKAKEAKIAWKVEGAEEDKLLKKITKQMDDSPIVEE